MNLKFLKHTSYFKLKKYICIYLYKIIHIKKYKKFIHKYFQIFSKKISIRQSLQLLHIQIC